MYMYCHVSYFDKIPKNWCLTNNDVTMVTGTRYNYMYLIHTTERSYLITSLTLKIPKNWCLKNDETMVTGSTYNYLVHTTKRS